MALYPSGRSGMWVRSSFQEGGDASDLLSVYSFQVQLGIPDYFAVIKRPMDLDTVPFILFLISLVARESSLPLHIL